MARAGLFIDSSLLVLLIVGSVGRDLIAKHRRLREYTAEDYQILIDLLGPVDRVFVTPNTLRGCFQRCYPNSNNLSC